MQSKNNSVFIVLLLILTLVGVFSQFTSYADFIIRLTPAHLLVSALLVFLSFKKISISQFVVLCLLFIISFFIEVIGVKTGVLFGEYHYGNNLGVKYWDVPLIIGLNWVMLAISTRFVMLSITNNTKLVVIFASVLMVALDFLIEQICSKLDFWHWESGFASERNYLAWFVISLCFQFLLNLVFDTTKNKVASFYFYMQLLFFICLNLM